MFVTLNQRISGFCVTAVISLSLGIEQPQAQELTDADVSLAYEEALGDGLYGEAEVAAKRLVEEAIRAGRQEEASTARLLGKLALAQRLNKNFDAALQNYELAIGIIESSHDMLDLELVEPLLGIGYTHIDNERPDLALLHLDRALHVRHVNNGPHSLEQSETLEALADAYKKMGESRKAVHLANRVYWLYSREFPGKSMEIVPALLKKGHILGEVGDRREQREAYIEAIEIVEHNEGKSSAKLISPVISLGRSHVEEYFDLKLLALSEEELPDTRMLDKAKSYYESALDLARTNADVPWQLHNDALLALGDFYTINDEQSRARELYRDAWQLLSADVARLGRRQSQLETVVPLRGPTPDLTVALPNDEEGNPLGSSFETGYIVTSFTVTRSGRLTDIGLVEISPERNADIEAEVKRNLSRFVYRPRLENGYVVDTSDQTIRYEFPLPKSSPVAE